MGERQSIVKLVFYCFVTPAPLPLCIALHMLHTRLFHRNHYLLTILLRQIYTRPILSNLRWPQYLPFPLLLPYLIFNSRRKNRIFLINMAPKRKATDAGSSTSPLKKRNAVTAGIGRAVESESNGMGFGYYGRSDDREDVSRTFLHPCTRPVIFRNPSLHRTTPPYLPMRPVSELPPR